jgi:hypothetical protein
MPVMIKTTDSAAISKYCFFRLAFFDVPGSDFTDDSSCVPSSSNAAPQFLQNCIVSNTGDPHRGQNFGIACDYPFWHEIGICRELYVTKKNARFLFSPECLKVHADLRYVCSVVSGG